MPNKNSKAKMTPSEVATRIIFTCFIPNTRTKSPEKYIETVQLACDYINLSVTVRRALLNGTKLTIQFEGKDAVKANEFWTSAKKCWPLGEYKLEENALIRCLQHYYQPKNTWWRKSLRTLKVILSFKRQKTATV